MYYRGAKAAVCVFDVTNESSYERVITWLRDLKIHADPNIVVCIAGKLLCYASCIIHTMRIEICIVHNIAYIK